MSRTVILSPHFDDAVFNCWHSIVNDGAVVMNIFSGIPPEGTKRFWDLVCGERDSVKMMHKRRVENEFALSISGSSIEQIYLDYLDSQYRSGQPDLKEMVEAVLSKAPSGSSFLAPLAGSRVYRHPDHVLARRVGVELFKRGQNVSFYPDVPYTTLPRNQHSRRLGRIESAASKLLDMRVALKVMELNEHQLETKRRAMKAYGTQYTMTNLESLGGLGRVGRRGYEVLLNPAGAS